MRRAAGVAAGARREEGRRPQALEAAVVAEAVAAHDSYCWLRALPRAKGGAAARAWRGRGVLWLGIAGAALRDERAPCKGDVVQRRSPGFAIVVLPLRLNERDDSLIIHGHGGRDE